MFKRNRIDLLYLVLCLLAFLLVIIFIDSNTSFFIIAVSFFVLTMFERRFENIFLFIVTLIIFIICLVMNNYLLLRIITCINYIHYFLNNEVIDDYEINERVKRDERYIRFGRKIERKIVDNNKQCTLFVVFHMVLLLAAIVVGK